MSRNASAVSNVNPAIATWTGSLGLPDFSSIDDRDFEAAFAVALPAHLAEIEAIASNPEEPTFKNTIAALELAGDLLTRASAIFWNMAGANTNDTVQKLERKLSPEFSRHHSAIMMNRVLFSRIDALIQERESLSLDAEADRVLELTWKSFVRSGAKLNETDQTQLAKINERLATLGTTFSQNILAEERDYALGLQTSEDMAGLPDTLISSMSVAAEERGHRGKLRTAVQK